VAYALARLKELYRIKYAETANGGNRGNQHTKAKLADCRNGELTKEKIDRFTAAHSKETGKAERTIQKRVAGALLNGLALKIAA
jgi:hypothetical protein